jgi:hypothetical protein
MVGFTKNKSLVTDIRCKPLSYMYVKKLKKNHAEKYC